MIKYVTKVISLFKKYFENQKNIKLAKQISKEDPFIYR